MTKIKKLGKIDITTGKWESKTIWYYIPSFIRRFL